MFGIQYAHLQRGEHVIHTICNRTHNLKKNKHYELRKVHWSIAVGTGADRM